MQNKHKIGVVVIVVLILRGPAVENSEFSGSLKGKVIAGMRWPFLL